MDEIWRGICLGFLSNISKVIENAFRKTKLLFCKKVGGVRTPFCAVPAFGIQECTADTYLLQYNV